MVFFDLLAEKEHIYLYVLIILCTFAFHYKMQTAKTTNMRKLTALMLAIAVAAMPMTLSAAIPSGYYSTAEGKSGQALLTALYNIINSHTKRSYTQLWTDFRTTDVDANGKLIDMYSTVKWTPGQKQCGNYSNVGDCYNREHSLPNSWWGGSEDERYTDLFHLYPTDGYVNNQRGNYPFGECANGNRLSNGSYQALGKLGASTFSGYSGTVFEPDDVYKGDFARTYFYLATCYYSGSHSFSSWPSSANSSSQQFVNAMLSGNSYPAFTTWALNLLLSWHRLDAVSTKETTRNDAVYGIQNNRNPFIDYPELVEYIWGNKVDTPWYPGGTTTNPVLAQPATGTTIDFGTVAAGSYTTQTITVKGTDLTESLTVSVSGNAFSCTTSTITAANANAGTTITVKYTAPSTAQSSTGTLTISSSEATTTVNLCGQSVTGIAALAATEVSSSSFKANWTPASGATSSTVYQLYVYEEDGVTNVSGYPKNVSATTGEYIVYNLEANTTYYYQLKYGNQQSNVVEVRTLGNNQLLAIQSDHDLEFELEMGATSNYLEAEVYTENISTTVTLTLGGDWGAQKFELSKNRSTWSSTLTIDPSGETFFIRVKDTSKWGSFEGLITATSGDLEYNAYVIAYITEGDPNIVETWEGADYKSSYSNTSNIQATAFKWDLVNTGIYGTQNNNDDRYNGEKCIRMRTKDTGGTANGMITMAEDKIGGASKISFLAAPYGGDANAELVVRFSTNQGATWNNLATLTIPKQSSSAPALDDVTIKAASYGSLAEYSLPVNVSDNIRFQFEQTSGKRLNIDDITISSYHVSTEAKPVVADQRDSWTVWAVDGGLNISSQQKLKFEVYNLDARRVAKTKLQGSRTLSLPAGIYIVTDGQSSRKVIVR